MKRLALILALFWSAQEVVCLLPGLAHAHDSSAAAHTDHASHRHHGAPAPDTAGTPAPEHDAGCEHHCVSLAQALSPLAPAVAWTATLSLPLNPPRMHLVVQLVTARRLDSYHGPPPPDLVITNASFLI